MAHFAKLDENNNVLSVIVVSNDVLDSLNEEQSGIEFLTNLFNHSNWKQTSYNNNIRRNFAAVGGIYDPIKDIFIHPKPSDDATFNSETLTWILPEETE
jgi:hypothetical protein